MFYYNTLCTTYYAAVTDSVSVVFIRLMEILRSANVSDQVKKVLMPHFGRCC